MSAPLSAQPTLGRIFGSDWTIPNVAKLLRFNAGQDFVRTGPLIGGLRDISENYPRTTSARHLPSGVTVTFRRDITGDWHAELCFAVLDHYLPWNDALAEEWLAALFLQDRPRVRDVTEGTPHRTPSATSSWHRRAERAANQTHHYEVGLRPIHADNVGGLAVTCAWFANAADQNHSLR